MILLTKLPLQLLGLCLNLSNWRSWHFLSSHCSSGYTWWLAILCSVCILHCWSSNLNLHPSSLEHSYKTALALFPEFLIQGVCNEIWCVLTLPRLPIKLFLESGEEPVTNRLELAIGKPTIWREKVHRKNRVGTWIWYFCLVWGTNEETCLLGLRPKSKVIWLLLSFSDLADFHHHIWLLNLC